MRRALGLSWLALSSAWLFCLPAVLAADKVELRLAKYTELGDAVRQQKGKVVVVDFWADF
jgi:hypothetical protein